jgi:hypothetical protein
MLFQAAIARNVESASDVLKLAQRLGLKFYDTHFCSPELVILAVPWMAFKAIAIAKSD